VDKNELLNKYRKRPTPVNYDAAVTAWYPDFLRVSKQQAGKFNLDLDDVLSYVHANIERAFRGWNPERGKFEVIIYLQVNSCAKNILKSQIRECNIFDPYIKNLDKPTAEDYAVDVPVAKNTAVDSDLLVNELYQQVMGCDLTPKEKKVLQCRMSGMTVGEAAEKCKLTWKQSDNAMERAKQKISRELGISTGCLRDNAVYQRRKEKEWIASTKQRRTSLEAAST
jgi:DNA-directed RNA polymerase specialized sigma24 family protein